MIFKALWHNIIHRMNRLKYLIYIGGNIWLHCSQNVKGPQCSTVYILRVIKMKKEAQYQTFLGSATRSYKHILIAL